MIGVRSRAPFRVGRWIVSPRRLNMLVELGSLERDLYSGFKLPLAANGPTTGPLNIEAPSGISATYDAAESLTIDGTTYVGILTVDGIDADNDADLHILCKQDADKPGTSETEQIEADLH